MPVDRRVAGVLTARDDQGRSCDTIYFFNVAENDFGLYDLIVIAMSATHSVCLSVKRDETSAVANGGNERASVPLLRILVGPPSVLLLLSRRLKSKSHEKCDDDAIRFQTTTSRRQIGNRLSEKTGLIIQRRLTD